MTPFAYDLAKQKDKHQRTHTRALGKQSREFEWKSQAVRGFNAPGAGD